MTTREATVAFLFTADLQEVLMLHRAKEPYAGKYNGVGGHVEEGEDPMSAAVREIREETGITAVHDFRQSMTVSYPSGWTLHVFHGWIAEKPFFSFYTPDGDFVWRSTKDMLDMHDPDIAGDGNVAYFIYDALRYWGCLY